MVSDDSPILRSALKKMKDSGVLQDYDLETYTFTIKSVPDSIRYMEKIALSGFKKAFPGCIIRKNAVDLYLAELFSRYTGQEKLNKETALITMMISLEIENMAGLTGLVPFLKEQFAKYDFEKVNMQ